MLIAEDFKRHNLILQEQIRKEISLAKQGHSTKNQDQLSCILEELIKMLDKKQLSLSFPRLIIDSWDYQDALGIELMNLYEAYCKLR